MNVGAISSSNRLAAEAAYKIMVEGGNAFDAAICATAVLAVVEPANSGIGGGGFWLLKKGNESDVVMIDSREESAANIDPKLYKKDRTLSKVGCHACAIPGLPAALDYINKEYGSLSLERCLKDAIDYAKNGFIVDQEFQRLANARIGVLKLCPDIQEMFLYKGETPPVGHRIIQKDLAATLKLISKFGHDGFYKGEVAQKLVDGVCDTGGLWTLEDLNNYKIKKKQPLKMNYRNAIINTVNSPSSGGAQLLLMLKIIDSIEEQLKPKTYTDELHLLLEAMYKSHYYRDKYLSDCDDISSHISDQTLELLTKGINLNLIDRPIKQCHRKKDYSEQTTHLSIIDKYGNCVSATLSCNFQFGSCIIPKGTGVVLNNQISDFSFRSSSPNYIGPRKRPLSNMTPCLIETDDYIYLIGTPGGIRISSMIFLSVLFLVNNPELAESVVDLPRFHHEYYPDVVEIEPGIFPQLLMESLENRGHKIVSIGRQFGNMQVVIFDKKYQRSLAITDKRYAGHAIAG